MALIKCKECGHQVSTEAKLCPGCGAKVDKPVGLLGITLVVILAIGVFQCTAATHESQQRQASIEAAKSPDLRAAEAKEAAESNVRYKMAVLAGTTLKQSLKDPSSLIFESINVDDSGKIICMTYRAKNSFGALGKEHIVYHNGTPSQKPSIWNKRCANKEMHDLTYAKQEIDIISPDPKK